MIAGSKDRTVLERVGEAAMRAQGQEASSARSPLDPDAGDFHPRIGGTVQLRVSPTTETLTGDGGGTGRDPGDENTPLAVVEWNDEVGVADMMKDERQFLQIVVEGTPYRALLDPGAMVTLVGRKIADRFRDRLQGSGTRIRTITGQTSAVEGLLCLSLDVAGVSGTLIARATAIPCHDVVLGIDFCKEFEIETS